MEQYIQVITTTAKQSEAQKLVREVLENRLAACGQIFPCTSMYWWQDTMESDSEYVCILKSRADLFDALEKLLTRIHPYQVPEIIALPITADGPAYLAWLDETLARPSAA